MINWIPLDNLEQLQEILKSDQTYAIFKHSTTCGISAMAKRNLERMANTVTQSYSVYYLDLLANRDLSNQIAQIWGIAHQSPQLLILKGKSTLFDASHGDIDFDDIVKYL